MQSMTQSAPRSIAADHMTSTMIQATVIETHEHKGEFKEW
jgi:hypothetical protein